MTLQHLLDQQDITKYQLSKMSGVPKTTIMDICAGRSSIERCSAKTVQLIAKTLGCSMEELMTLETPAEYDEKGLPSDKSYLECGLPAYLEESLCKMKLAWKKIDNGEEYLRWDSDYCTLQSDINTAEIGGAISPDKAWYLREKYLRMRRGDMI